MKRISMKLNTIVLLLLMMALIGAVVLVNKNQETRKGAYFAGARMYLLPSTTTVRNGEDLLVHLVTESGLKSGSDTEKALVENAQFYICYDKNLQLLPSEETERIVVNQENGFETKIVFYEENSTKNCANITVISGYGEAMRAKLKSGVVDVATVHFKTLSAGSGTVIIDKGLSKVSGTNDISIDKSISVDTVENMAYTISSGNDISPILNFKISFGGVVNSAKCAVDWPIRVTVLGNGETKTFSNVKGVRENISVSDNNLAVYKYSLRLDGFYQKQNLAVFIKGPKHLQMKYGVNDQQKLYDKAGGEINITSDADNSPIYNFSKLPLLAGDVTGGTVGVADGLIDGRDFSYVKAHGSLTAGREEVADGGYLQADLDGNCFTGVQDVTLLMRSLEEKQGQLY